jgi:2-methylcitrate dehydratase PrpD
MLMGNPDPHTGLEAKLSVHHCVAAAIVRGVVGVREFTDTGADDPALQALRARVSLNVDPAMPKESTAIAARLRDGKTIEKYIAHATGSLEKPMSDAALEQKFRDLAEWGCPHCDASAAIGLAWSLDRLPDGGVFTRALCPQ